MKPSVTLKSWTWLKSMPNLGELCDAYPHEWKIVDAELTALIEQGQAECLKAYLERSSSQVATFTQASKSRPGDKKSAEAALSKYVQNRMANLAVSRCSLAVAAGVSKGKIRFNLFNGFVAQKLLFARAFERKPASLFWFRLCWPLLRQRKLLMPLVQSRGIYCFYSRSLIDKLVRMLASRSCLEIAAGDGTLSRFLKERGVDIVATDNYGWQHAVRYPADVVNLDAVAALAKYSPEVVICSWPPADNTFERQVFVTDSVQLYIVISCRHRFASGNWHDYLSQNSFVLQDDRRLAAMVLPPELESAVYLFSRKARSEG